MYALVNDDIIGRCEALCIQSKEMETDRKMKGKQATKKIGGGCPRATLKSYEKQHFINKNIIYSMFRCVLLCLCTCPALAAEGFGGRNVFLEAGR